MFKLSMVRYKGVKSINVWNWIREKKKEKKLMFGINTMPCVNSKITCVNTMPCVTSKMTCVNK